MNSMHRIVILCALASAGACASVDEQAQPELQSSSDALAGFSADRNGRCTAGCAGATVCDNVLLSCVAEPMPPSVQFPVSGAITTGSPAFAWASGPNATESVIEVCADALCTQSIARAAGAKGATLAAALPRGSYFLRAWGQRKEADGHIVPGATASQTRVWRSNGSVARSKSALGWFSDFDANGLADLPGKLGSGTTARLTPRAGRVDQGVITLGGKSFVAPTTVPDMNGDGRTEIVELRRNAQQTQTQLVISSLALDNRTVSEVAYDVAYNVRLLAIGDVDRDGYFDVGAVQDLSDGVRLEVFYGGPNFATRRLSYDLRMPLEAGSALRYWVQSITAIGDIDNDGYPDISLGGYAAATPPPHQTEQAPAGRFLLGYAETQRLFVFRGGATRPYSRTAGTFVREGAPNKTMQPIGDVNGDGVMDMIGLDTTPTCWAEWKRSDLGDWISPCMAPRPGMAFVVLGGTTLKKSAWTLPRYVSEGPGQGYDMGILGRYEALRGLRRSTAGVIHDEVFYDIDVTAGADLNGDGYADIALWSNTALSPELQREMVQGQRSSNAATTSYTTLAPMDNSTWRTNGAFIDVRYGSRAGIGATPDAMLISPTHWNQLPDAIRTRFPAVIEPRTDGLFASELTVAASFSGSPYSAFSRTFTGEAATLSTAP